MLKENKSQLFSKEVEMGKQDIFILFFLAVWHEGS